MQFDDLNEFGRPKEILTYDTLGQPLNRAWKHEGTAVILNGESSSHWFGINQINAD